MHRVPLPAGEVGFRAVLCRTDLAGAGSLAQSMTGGASCSWTPQLVAGAAGDIHFADHHRPEVGPAPGVAHAAADTASAAMQVR